MGARSLELAHSLSKTYFIYIAAPVKEIETGEVGWSSQYDIDLRPALQGGVLRDKPLKHYFSHSEVRGKLTHLNRVIGHNLNHRGLVAFKVESCNADSGSSPWKFWRRLSARGRQDHKSSHRKDRPTIVLLDKSDPTQITSELSPDLRSPQNVQSTTRSLPDVVEKAQQGLPRCSPNGVPPPKPPRLFLFRTPSTVTKHSTDTENESDPTYMNCKQVNELRPDHFTSSLDSTLSDPLIMASSYIKSLKLSDMAENNNLLCQVSKNETGPPQSAPVNSVSSSKDSVSVSFNLPPESSSPRLSSTSIPPGLQNSIRKPKIKTPEMSLKRMGRPRRKSSDKGELTRQKLIMNSIAELMRQRLDPFPLIDQLKKAGVLTNLDVQFFLGLHDRKSVCESLVGLVGDSTPDVLPIFCDVMAQTGNCTELLEASYI
ncbi:hypothetical protein Btru_051098 [Bulinus truncatus]|nr:hypothetical protein Btru_051098 [Bulinus truncatus]